MDSRFHCVSEEMHGTYCPMRSQEAALHDSTVVYFEVFHDAISCQLHYQQDEQLVKLHTILFECFTFPQFRTPKTQAGTGLAQSAVVCPSAAACEPLASGICGRLPTVIQHLGGLTHRTLLLIQRFRDSLAKFEDNVKSASKCCFHSDAKRWKHPAGTLQQHSHAAWIICQRHRISILPIIVLLTKSSNQI